MPSCLEFVESQDITRMCRMANLGHPSLRLARSILSYYFNYPDFSAECLRDFGRNPWGRHSTGAVSDKSKPSQKWRLNSWPGLNGNLFRLADRSLITKKLVDQPAARVCAVPKDYRGPRIICIEPKENQFAQQGLMELLYRFISRHPMTRGSISFREVEASKNLCMRKDLACLDLKDASDLLSLALARFLLPKWIFSIVTAYRTRNVTWNGHRVPTRCLATMGSAVCFPLETLVFWAIARASTRIVLGEGYRTKDIRVFGDDIILPREAASNCIEALESAGLVVNHEKTCLHTLVKESCGAWVLAGVNQPVIKLKTAEIVDLRSWLAWLDYSKSFQKAGLPALAATMMECCLRFLPPARIKTRWSRNLQKQQFRVPQIVNAGNSVRLDGDIGLYAYFATSNQTPSSTGTQKVKWRWVDNSPYMD